MLWDSLIKPSLNRSSDTSHAYNCFLNWISPSMKDPHKDSKMPNNKMQEVALILHHGLVPLLDSWQMEN